MRGPKPQSTATKRLRGNPGKRALNADEPQPPAPTADFDTPPPEMAGNKHAAATWRRLAPLLRESRQVTDADRDALVALCLEWSRYTIAMRRVTHGRLLVKSRLGNVVPNPYLPIANKALAACNRLWVELGLTPSSRSRVKAAGPPPDEDGFEEFDRPAIGRIA